MEHWMFQQNLLSKTSASKKARQKVKSHLSVIKLSNYQSSSDLGRRCWWWEHAVRSVVATRLCTVQWR